MLRIALCLVAVALLLAGFAYLTGFAMAWGFGPAILTPLYLLGIFIVLGIAAAAAYLTWKNRHA
jgi:hypothetical protein